MDKRKAVKRMLSNLSRQNFDNFCDELLHRKEEPRVARNRVEGKSFLEITEVLISAYNETGAIEVAAEVLNEIECKEEAAELLAVTVVEYSEPASSNTARPSPGETAHYTMVDGEHFVDKHRTELIKRVCRVEDILDQLLDKKVMTPSSYNEILAKQTTQMQIRRLFSGELNSAGLRGKEVFYRILEKEEKYLIDDLKGKK